MEAKKYGKMSAARNTKSTGRKIREKIHMGAYSLGNSVETVGKKLQKNGYHKFGAKVEKVGDLIEHMGDKNYNKTEKERNL